jgi:hypothetical protein
MIGKIMIGKSFGGCIRYCLEDKKQEQEEAVFQHRSEVLYHNLCYGNKQELTEQFNDVRRLNPRLSKPVLHITLSLAPGERLDKDQLAGIVADCAREFGFDRNQFLAVEHLDTKHQHVHLVANRVGFDGKALSDSNNFKKMAAFCRRMEQQYNLRPVLSPRRFLSREQQQLPRLDQRKEQLRNDIRQSLKECRDYSQFVQRMEARGYAVLKGRGIAFTDQQAVRTKGSEVDYPLRRIEDLLQRQQHALRAAQEVLKIGVSPGGGWSAAPLQANNTAFKEWLGTALRTEANSEALPYELTESFGKKKKKKRGLSH